MRRNTDESWKDQRAFHNSLQWISEIPAANTYFLLSYFSINTIYSQNLANAMMSPFFRHVSVFKTVILIVFEMEGEI